MIFSGGGIFCATLLATAITGLSVADINAGLGQMKVMMSVQHGDLSFNTAGTTSPIHRLITTPAKTT